MPSLSLMLLVLALLGSGAAAPEGDDVAAAAFRIEAAGHGGIHEPVGRASCHVERGLMPWRCTAGLEGELVVRGIVNASGRVSVETLELPCEYRLGECMCEPGMEPEHHDPEKPPPRSCVRYLDGR